MTKLIVAFHNFANAHKISVNVTTRVGRRLGYTFWCVRVLNIVCKWSVTNITMMQILSLCRKNATRKDYLF